MTKHRLKTMKQMRSMTAAAIIHSFIICWFLSVWWRSRASLRSLVSSRSLIELNRRSTELTPCSADRPTCAAAATDDDDDGSFVSSKSWMLCRTSDVDLKLFTFFSPTHSFMLTMTFFCTGNKLSSWPLCAVIWSLWISSRRSPLSLCFWPTRRTRRLLTSLHVMSLQGGEDGFFSRTKTARRPQM